MQASTARRVALFVALAGSAAYFRFAGHPEHRLVIVVAIAVIISGLTLSFCLGVRRGSRISLMVVALALLLATVLLSLGPRSSRGIYVFLAQDLLAKAVNEPTGPLLVLLRMPRSSSSNRSRIFVNDHETDWRNLRGVLLTQLSLRPDWVVFIDADPALPYDDLIHAVDVVTQLSAKPVLLSRRIWQRRPLHTPSVTQLTSAPYMLPAIIPPS